MLLKITMLKKMKKIKKREMKNFIILFLLLSFTFDTYSQMEKVTSAYDYFRKKQYDKAKDRIDIAIENESSNVKAKTWQYRAYIYQSIASSENPNIKALDLEAHVKCREAYLKSKELDVKGKYSDQVKEGLAFIERHFFVSAFNKYKAAYDKRKANVSDPEAEAGYKLSLIHI